MTERFHHRGWHYALLITAASLVVFLNLGGATLWDMDEGKNATCAYEMFVSGNWIVPTFNGSLRVDKPVLLYWLQILSYMTFGVNEFAARFPSAMAALATVLLAYELARAMFTRTTGLLAGLIVATTPMICGAGRFANPDALLNCCTAMTFTVFWLGFARRTVGWFVLLGATLGLGVLAKGPVGVALPAAVIWAFVIWERRWSVLLDLRWGYTYLVFALTAIPWYVLVGLETHGEFLRGFLLKHNLERGMSAMENHHGFPGYYLVVLLIGMMPWSIFLGLAFWYGAWSAIRTPWQRWCHAWWLSAAEQPKTQNPNDATAAYRLLACWIGVYVIFFSIAATKLPNYVLPVVVPCGVLVARFLQRWRTEAIRPPIWLGAACVVSLAGIGLAVALGLIVAGGAWELPMMRGRSYPGLEYWAILGIVPITAALLCWRFARSRQTSRMIGAIAAAALVLLAPLAAFGSALFNSVKAPDPLAAETGVVRLDEDIRIGSFRMEHLPSLNFYVKRDVEYLPDEIALRSLLRSRLPVFVFMPAEDWRRAEAEFGASVRLVGRHYDMFRHREIVVVTNR